MTQIGKNIKKIRNVKRLSQQAFADLFDLTRGNISSYEESRAEPKIEAMIRIANFFGIPLVDFIEKDLSVNELLHYNTHFVTETEILKNTYQLTKTPFVSIHYIRDYVQYHKDPVFMKKLPVLTIPCNSKSELIALELESSENLPAGFDFRNGNILFFELITKENIHRIINKLGIMIDTENIKFGIYRNENHELSLSLNEWINYPFNIGSDIRYFVLRASFKQEE
ncbi:MAG: helix-turn-helix domain-containing protein [Tannerella sp.]|jgi:transcriptional regulator with XRE-family HTH domain|nr:helix-turn-helix domain-containing protein [Tannerella sp.]